MPATPLAEAFVRVRALTDKFKDDVEKGFAGIGDKFGKQFAKDVSARLRQERGAFAQAGAQLGEAAGDAAGTAFGQRMAERGAEAFSDNRGDFVAVAEDIGEESGDAGGERFGEQFSDSGVEVWSKDRSRIIDEAEELGEDSGDAFSRGFERRAGGGAGDSGRRHGRQYGDGFADGMGSGFSRVADVGQRALARLLPGLGGLTRGFASATSAAGGLLATVGKWSAIAAGVAALGAAAASAAGYTLALTAALTPVSGLLAALPGIALTGASAFTVWKLATGGLGEAMGAALSDNVEALSAAMGKLSGSGRAFINEFMEVTPLLRSFQQAAQGAFLDQILGQLHGWLWALAGLKPAIRDVAAEMGGLVRSFFGFVTSRDAIVQLDVVLRDTHLLIGAIHGALQPLLQGFFDLGVVGSNWLASMSGGLQDVLTRFGQWMSQVAASGQAWAWLEASAKVLRQFGTLLKNVWDILVGLLDAARKAGGDVLGVLGQLTGAAAKWVKSAEGQKILVTIFEALNRVGAALMPIIEALAVAIGAIAPAVAELAEALGPVLASAIRALGPAIAAIGPGITAMINGIGSAVAAIAPALIPLGQAIASVFATLQPLIAAIGPAISALLPGVQTFFQAFATGLAALTPALPLLGSAIGGVAAALAPLLPAVGQLASLIVSSLASGIQAILPSLSTLVGALVQTLQAVSPIIPLIVSLAATMINSLVPAIAPLLPQLAALVTQLIQGLVPALTPLIPIIAEIAGVLGQTFVSLLAEIVAVLVEILPPLSETARILGMAFLDAIRQLGPLLPPLVGAFLSALPAIANLLPPLAELAAQLLPRFVGILTTLLPHLPAFIEAMIALTQATYPLIPLFIDLLKRLEPHIPLFAEIAAVLASKLLPELTKFLTVVLQVVNGVLKAFTELYDRLVGNSIIPDLITGIGGWVSRLPGMFAQWIGEAKDWAIRKFNELLNWASGLPGAIVGALSGIGSQMGTIGHNLIVGIWNGMVGAWQWFRDSIYNFFSGIMPDWVKNALGIASPSKLFAAIGKELPAGLAIGMDVGTPMVKAAADRMADATVATFDAPASPAPAFEGAFPVGHQALPAAPPAGGRVINVENINVQGVFDPSSPVSYRRMVEQLRSAIIDLEQEEYVHG